MIRSAAIYGSIMALAAFVFRWMEYRHSVRMFSTELYILFVALTFTALGVWLGRKLTGSDNRQRFARYAFMTECIAAALKIGKPLGRLPQELQRHQQILM